jgi:F1F0 ATPase subunit 2
MMNEALNLVLAVLMGFLLGVLFYGGLWWTLRESLSSRKPAFWIVVSFWTRTSIVVSGFYFISKGDGERLLVCLLGFVMARFVVKNVVQLRGKPAQVREGDRAP